MTELSDAHAMALERSCAVAAAALSEQRRDGVRLVTGDRRTFGLNATLKFVHVPYPAVIGEWTRRTVIYALSHFSVRHRRNA
jgi:nitric oxide reductase NorD protein